MIKYFIWVLISGMLIGATIEFEFPLYIAIPIGLNFIGSLCGIGLKILND